MTKTWSAKDPDEVLDYTYDWSLDLSDGETLVAADSTFDVVTAAGTAVDSTSYGQDFVTVVISGGTDGEQAVFTMRVATTGGRVLEDTVVLPIRTSIVPVLYPGGYVDPTPANLVCMFPEFGTVSSVTLQSYLNRAARWVDASWTEGDFGEARMLLAAHMLTIMGLGDTAEAKAINDGSGEFRSMRIGSLQLERFDKGSVKASTFGTTRYGREFQTLLRRNRGGPRVAGFAGVPDRSEGDHFGPWTA